MKRTMTTMGCILTATTLVALTYWILSPLGASTSDKVNFIVAPALVITNTPYAIHVYTLTLTNNGATTDTFSFTHAATDTSALPPGPPATNEWVVRMPTDRITVSAGLSATIHVTVEIPAYEVKWVTHTLVVTATSTNYSTEVTSTLKVHTGGQWDAVQGLWVRCRFDFVGAGMVKFVDAKMTYDLIGRTDAPKYEVYHAGQVIFADAKKIYDTIGTTCEP